jgi:diguanylate cyclase (GGDEF)-like protein
MLARALGAAPDERRASGVVRRYVEQACEAENVVLIACGPERGRAVIHYDVDAPTALAAAATPGGTCLTVRLGRPHARRAGDSPLLACELCGGLTGDTACAPLTAAGAVVGAVLATGGTLVDDAPEILDDIAAIAGPAIAALRSFDLAAAHAHTDGLTGVPNRRAAEDGAERMVAHARRRAESLSMMRVDLDGIAGLNDRLGTEAGDGVIQSLAAVLRARLRSSDLVARFGGDEFVVLLPDTAAEVAVELAEGLCRLARELTPPGANDPVTVSVGIASFPLDGESAQDVLTAAERALLDAKTAGGDRVTAVDPPDPWSLLSD